MASTIHHRRAALALLAVGALAACTASHQASPVMGQAERLDPGGKFFVSVPSDGRYGSTPYPGSGDAVASALQAALLRHVARVERGTVAQDMDGALATAREQGATYLVVPVITQWEDRATEWSGLPDRIEVVVTVLDAQSGRLLVRSSLKGRSSWWTLGGDRPQDLLARTSENFVAGLF